MASKGRSTSSPRQPSSGRRRGTVKTWSKKSRNRMLYTLNTLDFADLERKSRVLVLVTLTYPDAWREVAPDGSAVQWHLKLLRQRFQRAFGQPLVGIWKLEFQLRGAPHFHLLVALPTTAPPGGGSFSGWLSHAWSSILNISDPGERQRHLRAGVFVGRPRRATLDGVLARTIAYFYKDSKGGKSYQDDAPSAWVEAGSTGRRWGYWGLRSDVTTIETSYSQAVRIGRTLRKLTLKQRAQARLTFTSVQPKRRAKFRRRYRGPFGFFLLVRAGTIVQSLLDWVFSDSRTSNKAPGLMTGTTVSNANHTQAVTLQEESNASEIPPGPTRRGKWSDRLRLAGQLAARATARWLKRKP